MLAELHTVMVAWVASPTSSFNSMMDEARVARCNATSIERRVVDVLVFGSNASCAQMHFYLDPVGISPQADHVIPLTITDNGCVRVIERITERPPHRLHPKTAAIRFRL